MSARGLSSGALVALALAGCASGPPTRFFTLDPAPPPAGAPALATAIPPVRVDAVHIPPVLDRPELVRETTAHEIAVSDFAHWSAPLGELARRTLTQDLLSRLPQGAVTFPDAPKPPNGRGIVIDVLALGHDADGSAVMDASWTLTAGQPARGVTVAYTGRALRLRAPGGGAGPEATAAEFSALLGRLADAVAADLGVDKPGAGR